MPRYETTSSLVTWLNGGESLQSFVNGSRFLHSSDIGAWVALEEVYLAHEALTMSPQSLEDSWEKTKTYVESALKIVFTGGVETPESVHIDHEDRWEILEKLGEPPKPCLPLYIFSVDNGKVEIPVYVGITNSKKSRFSGGHRAALKLLDPKYDGLVKRLYFCQVMFLSQNNEYLPLEWLHPFSTAESLLDDAESELIFRLQPELNVKKKSKNYSKSQTDFLIVNYSDRPDFLDK